MQITGGQVGVTASTSHSADQTYIVKTWVSSELANIHIIDSAHV